jgi:hypothetical protein
MQSKKVVATPGDLTVDDSKTKRAEKLILSPF